jgi:hypothetical protein
VAIVYPLKRNKLRLLAALATKQMAVNSLRKKTQTNQPLAQKMKQPWYLDFAASLSQALLPALPVGWVPNQAILDLFKFWVS